MGPIMAEKQKPDDKEPGAKSIKISAKIHEMLTTVTQHKQLGSVDRLLASQPLFSVLQEMYTTALKEKEEFNKRLRPES